RGLDRRAWRNTLHVIRLTGKRVNSLTALYPEGIIVNRSHIPIALREYVQGLPVESYLIPSAFDGLLRFEKTVASFYQFGALYARHGYQFGVTESRPYIYTTNDTVAGRHVGPWI